MNFDRIDTWVFKVSIAVPVICAAGVVLWHLFWWLSGKLKFMSRPRRVSPEPSAAVASADAAVGDPERLERVCAAQAEALAESYLKLADAWTHLGQAQRATAVLQQLVQRCPDTRAAQVARERLQQMVAVEKLS